MLAKSLFGLLVLWSAFWLLLPAPEVLSADAPFDLVIRGGKIVDGTGNPWYHGDVAIRGQRLVTIGKVAPHAAKRTIEASGLVVAPGFIDIHSHSDFHLLEDGSAQSK